MDAYTANLLGALAVGCFDAQDAAMEPVGLDAAELSALLAVYARPGSRVGDVARTVRLTHSGAVRVIDRLSRAGWVERRIGRDRRTAAIHCTEGGLKKARLALSLRREALQEAARRFTASELTAFRRLAKKLLSSLPGERSDAWRICRFCDHRNCRGADYPVGSAVP